MNDNSPHFLGDSFKIWFGIVEDNNDREKNLGRVKVRIIGFHTPKKSELPTEDLPWAIVLNSTENPAINGKGTTPSKLKAGSTVCGFFLDSDDCQQPVVIGSLFSKIVDETILSSKPEVDTVQDYENPGAVYINSRDVSDFEPTAEKEAIAKSEERTIANPNGQPIVSVANGNSGSSRTFLFDVSESLNEIANSIKHMELYNYEGLEVTKPVGKIDNLIRVNRTKNLPSSGIIQINNELLSYNGKNDKYLTEVSRGIYETLPSTHEVGSAITFPEKIANGRPNEIVSKFTGKVIDFRKEVERIILKIKNYLKWLVNSIKSTLTSLVSDIIIRLGSILKSILPYQTKVIIEALYKILQRIECNFDFNFVENIVSKVRNYIENMVNTLINKFIKGVDDFISDISTCLSDIFDSVISLSIFVEDILNMIDDSLSLIGKTNTAINMTSKTGFLRDGINQYNAQNTPSNGDIFNSIGTAATSRDAVRRVDDSSARNFVESVNTVGNTVGLLLDLLGIGCNFTTKQPKKDFYTLYNSGIKVECADFYRKGNIGDTNLKKYSNLDCSFFEKELNIPELLSLYRRPIKNLHKIISDGESFLEEIDITPGAERYSKYGPRKTSEEILADGSKVVTVNGDNYTVVMDNDHVNIRGTCYVTVDGDYHLKVNGDYHLEVLGEYNLHVGSESKQTYCGEHTTLFKNSAKVNSISGYSLTGTKIGLSSAGNIDLESQGALGLISSEVNIASSGSYNIGCLAYNKTVLYSSTTTILKDQITLVGINKISATGNTETKIINNSKTTLVGNSKVNIQNGSSTDITGSLKVSNVSGGDLNYANNRMDITSGLQSKINKGLQLQSGKTHVIV